MTNLKMPCNLGLVLTFDILFLICFCSMGSLFHGLFYLETKNNRINLTFYTVNTKSINHSLLAPVFTFQT